MNKFATIAATAAVALTALATPAFAQYIRVPVDVPSTSPNYPGSSDNYPGGDKPRAGGSYDCSTQFGHFRRVLPQQVAGIDDSYRVWVTPVCVGGELMRSYGNAAHLRATIADNEVLTEALFRKNFGPDNVFAVKMMGDDTINLYVHHFAR